MTQKVNGAAYPGIWVEKQVTFIKLVFSKDISALLTADLLVLGTSTPAGALTAADSSFGVVESALVQALKNLEQKATVLGISNYKQLTPSVIITTGSASSTGTTINIVTTTFAVGQTVAVTAGTGVFLPGTKVVSITDGTHLVVSVAPLVALSGATVTGSTYAGGEVDVMLGYADGWFSDASGSIATAQAVTSAVAQVFAPGASPTNVAGALVSVNDASVTFTVSFVAFDGSMPVATYNLGTLEFLADGTTPGSAASPMGASGYYPPELAAA